MKEKKTAAKTKKPADPVGTMSDHYVITGLLSNSLRQHVRIGLIAGGVDPSDEIVAHVARCMASREGSSLLDEIEALKGKARRAVGG